MAHDFNNLLTVIRGSVDLLRRDNLSEEKRRTYIDAIGSTADRASDLTKQLLAFARRQALTPELIDTGASLMGLATMIETLTGSRITLQTQVPDYPCYIMADRAQLDTAIVNMAVNARDAMGGAGALTIATGPVSGIPKVRAHPPVTGDYVAVTVTDTGSGIAEGDLISIFEPFFTTKAVGQGTGLGLSQVFGFAKQSGGDVRVDSKVGKGTTFTLYLPRCYPNPDELLVDDAPAELVDGEGLQPVQLGFLGRCNAGDEWPRTWRRNPQTLSGYSCHSNQWLQPCSGEKRHIRVRVAPQALFCRTTLARTAQGASLAGAAEPSKKLAAISRFECVQPLRVIIDRGYLRETAI